MLGYSPSAEQVLKDCETVLKMVAQCRASDGTKCVPNDEDFENIDKVLFEIYNYFEDRRIPCANSQ